MFEDKAAFDPYVEWPEIYDYFMTTEYRPNPDWTFKTEENYHQK